MRVCVLILSLCEFQRYIHGILTANIIMSNDVDTETPPNDSECETDELELILQIKHQLLSHQMALRQHEHQMVSPQDRLTLMVINTVSSVFFITVVAAGVAVFAGVISLGESGGTCRKCSALLRGWSSRLYWTSQCYAMGDRLC